VSTTTLRIAWRNLGRNRKRSFLVLLAVALGQLAFLSTAALMRGYGDEYIRSLTGPLVGHLQVHAPGWREDRSIDEAIDHLGETLAEIRRDPEVTRASPRIMAPALAAVAEDGFMAMVVGLDPAAESHESGLLAGESPGARLGAKRVLVGRNLALRSGIEPGMEIAIVGQDLDGSIANDLYTVSGVLMTPVDMVNSLGIVMDLGDAQRLFVMGDRAHEIVVYTRDLERVEGTVERLKALPSLGGTEILSWQEIVPHVTGLSRIIRGFGLIVLAIVFIAAASGIANTMLMSTFERTHEFGMLLSLGCDPGRLARIMAVEAALLGLLGVMVGTALGLTFVVATGESWFDYAALSGRDAYEVAFQGLHLTSVVHPRIHLSDVGVGVAAVLLTAFVSVLWPMVHIARLEPMEAMRA